MRVLERYPALTSLANLVDETIIEQTVGRWYERFEADFARARRRIPNVGIGQALAPEVELGGIRLERFLGHWGNVSIEEVAKICLVARWLRPLTVLELGTYNGMTTLQIALNCDAEATVHTVDLPPGTAPERPLNELERTLIPTLMRRYDVRTGAYFEGRADVRIRQTLGDSTRLDFGSLSERPFDLVFIDAAHDYESKRLDTEAALRHLAPGGVILWHNYADVLNPEVTTYLADLAETGLPMRQIRGTMLVVHHNAKSLGK